MLLIPAERGGGTLRERGPRCGRRRRWRAGPGAPPSSAADRSLAWQEHRTRQAPAPEPSVRARRRCLIPSAQVVTVPARLWEADLGPRTSDTFGALPRPVPASEVHASPDTQAVASHSAWEARRCCGDVQAPGRTPSACPRSAVSRLEAPSRGGCLGAPGAPLRGL